MNLPSTMTPSFYTAVFLFGILNITLATNTQLPPVPPELPVNYSTTRAMLTVNGKYVLNSSYTAIEDGNVTMTCVVDGNPPPLVKFHKDSINVKTWDLKNQSNRLPDRNQNYTVSYNIPEVTCEDEGNYVCQAGNGVDKKPSVEGLFHLNVICSPKLPYASELLPNYWIGTGENLILGFKVLSRPRSALAKWSLQRENSSKDILNDNVDFNQTVSVFGNVHEITLVHYNITKNITGLYTLGIVNGHRNLFLNYSIWIKNDTETDSSNSSESDSGRNSTPEVQFTAYLPYVTITFFSGVILLVVLALAFKGPMNTCVEGCVDLLSCNCSHERKPRLWFSAPSHDDINDEMNNYHLRNCDIPLPDCSFDPPPLMSSNSFGKISNININIKDYRDSGTM